MKISEAMSDEVLCCAADATLNDAAHVMWERDCGFVPVTDRASGRFVGVITDRDVCMAAYTQGRPLREVSIGAVMTRNVVTIREDADVLRALELMKRRQLHRLPVVNGRGDLVGVLSLTDVARRTARRRGAEMEQLRGRIGAVLADIGRPRALASTG